MDTTAAAAAPQTKDWKYTLAGILSYALHPFVMLLITVVLLLFGNNFISILPLRFKYYVLSVVAVTTIVIPAVSIFLFKKTGLIQNVSLGSKEDRILPIIIVGLSYLFCYYILSVRIPVPFMGRVLCGAVIAIVICLSVNFFWKISLHMAAIGGVTGVLLNMNILGYGFMPGMLAICLIAAGLLGTARLYLGKHNIWQVAAGFTAGVLATYLTLYF